MASQGVEAMLALRRQLQEKKALLKRQVEQERGRVARLAKSPLNIVPSITHHPMQVGAGKRPSAGNSRRRQG